MLSLLGLHLVAILSLPHQAKVTLNWIISARLKGKSTVKAISDIFFLNVNLASYDHSQCSRKGTITLTKQNEAFLVQTSLVVDVGLMQC